MRRLQPVPALALDALGPIPRGEQGEDALCENDTDFSPAGFCQGSLLPPLRSSRTPRLTLALVQGHLARKLIFAFPRTHGKMDGPVGKNG